MIELRSVTKVYSTAVTTVTALSNINLTIQRGEFIALVGPAGCGKSTLTRVIGCLEVPSSGQMTFLGVDPTTLNDDELSRLRSRTVGFIFRSGNLVDDLTVRENVELPLLYAGVRRARHERGTMALAQLGLLERAEQPVVSLFLADQQRVALARAIANDPLLVVADDPTGSIDMGSAEELLCTLTDWHTQGRTIVLATDDERVASVASRIVRLAEGSITTAPRAGAASQERTERRAELGA